MFSYQEKQEIAQKIRSNQHEIFLVSMEEMDAIVRSYAKGKIASIRTAWGILREKIEFSASYYSSVGDINKLSKLVRDLGGITTKSYIKYYGGKPHIVLKGNPALRKVLTGTKYGIKNPRIITMGLGKASAALAAKCGGILSVVLLSAYRVADYFLTDKATLSQLVGTLATDIVKVGIATGASICAVSLFGAGVTIAIGPILAVVIVGIGVAWLLGEADKKYAITDQVIAGLDEIEKNTLSYAEQSKNELKNKANETVAAIIDYTIDISKLAVIDFAKQQIRKLLPSNPEIY